MLLFTFLLVLLLDINLVTSHATHGGMKASQDRLTSSLNDALLSYLCRGKNGLQCSGHGQCSGGMCACDRGYSGMKCDINSADMPPVMAPTGLPSLLPGDLPPALPMEIPPMVLPGDLSQPIMPMGLPPNPIPSDMHAPPSFLSTGFPFEPMLERTQASSTESSLTSDLVYCTVQDESICSGHGLCQGGRCVCDTGFSGTICELSSKVGFCKTYRECAECTAFMVPCPEKCSKMGSLYLVYGFPDSASPLWTCRFRSSKFQCYFYFQKEYEDPTGYKSIQVIPCMDYRKLSDVNVTTEDPFTTTEMMSSSTTTTTSTTASTTPRTTVTDVKTRAPTTQTTTILADDDSISDRKKAKPGSGSATVSVSSMLLVVCLWMLSQ